MPLLVRELVVRATVTPREAPEEPERKRTPGDDWRVIEECVEQVLEILRRREER